ncbi:MAG: NmrA family NAD(P)-binding protein, partial [Verrucomicrobiota bacterium]
MSATGTRKVLVTGGTGRQGGAAIPHLASLGHSVRVMTRNPDKARGWKVPNVEVVRGDFRDPDSLRSALDGVDGVFLMGTPFEGGPEAEVAAGKAMIDACAQKDIGHVVYSSVCCAGKRTGVPHFESKHVVEEY